MTFNFISGRAASFAAGVAVGIGASWFVRSGLGHRAAVSVTAKGMALKDGVLAAAERTKEAAQDIAAEARASSATTSA